MLSRMLLLISIFTLAFLLVFTPYSSVLAAPNSNASNKAQAASTKIKIKNELKNFDKPLEKSNNSNKLFGKNASTNSGLYSSNIDEVVTELGEVAEEEEDLGNEEVADEIEEIIEDEEESAEEVAEVIEEIESRNKFKTALIGTSYKNLGALRSYLVHNRNQIRKLTKAAEGLESEGSGEIVSEQLTTLMQERERIKTVIEDGESTFSILGWITKFLSGYVDEPIDDSDLVDEVGDAIDDLDGEDGEEDPDATPTPEPTASPVPTIAPTVPPSPSATQTPTSSPTS